MLNDSASAAPRKHTNGWITILALGLLAIGLLACLYVLSGSAAAAQVVGAAPQTAAPSPAAASPATASPVTAPAPAGSPAYRRSPVSGTPVAGPLSATGQGSAAPQPSNLAADEWQVQSETVREELSQSRENLRQAVAAQHSIRVASALFLAVFAVIAGLIVMQVYLQARAWDRDAAQAVAEVEAVSAQLEVLRDAREDARNALPGFLQEIGEQPLSFQEEGTAFAPRGLVVMEDVDHLAYVGQGRLAFRDLPSQQEAAVYLNGLLLSAVSHLNRLAPWTAMGRLDQFFTQLTRFPDAVDHRRIAQGYSYRALAAYQVLEAQDKEPSWLRKAERAQIDSLSKQAFTDVSQAASIDPDWKHTSFVEAMLCGRFYTTPEGDSTSRSDLSVRGLRRAVGLYRGLIEEKQYRGPARRNLVRALKQIAEQTGEKGDFSDFGYALNSFPTDDELADEALAGRQPNSQDRFLWQWLLGDEELFANVERLNLAEYRAFWIRMLDTKVHLRNWRADLAELQQSKPAMKDWNIQLLQAEPPISLANSITRRQERFDSPASGA